MNMYNKLLALAFCLTPVLLTGCSDGNEGFTDPTIATVTTNPGVISQKNFSILASDWAPQVIQPDGSFQQTDVTLTVFAGDRDNQTVTDGHVVFFESEYGLINPPSCTTDENGTCEVTWSAITPPDPAPAPGSDYRVTITAYTDGEESFTDSNGNSVFDDGDAGFEDIEEPYIDADYDGTFTPGDKIIDVISTNDPSGANLVHDIADGFFNGVGCTHSSLCAVRTSVVIWADIQLWIDGPPAPAP